MTYAPDDPVVEATPDFGSFYQREYRDVLGLAIVLCRDRSVAEDLVQDAFAAAYRNWDTVARMDRPDAWVRRVLVNASASKFRRLTAEARALTRLGLPPVKEFQVSAESTAVWDAIRKLPVRQAEVIVLVYYVGLSHAEAAEVMGCTVGTSRTHLKRAKVRLAKTLGDRL